MLSFLIRLLIPVMLGVSTIASAGGEPKVEDVKADDLKTDVLQVGEAKSVSCHACHGSDGISINNLWPNLAGQKLGYLIKQITAFRDGTRQDPIMGITVKNLSDQDIADIAAFYSSLSGVEKPRATLH